MKTEIKVNDLFSYVRKKIKFQQDKIGGNFIVTEDANKRLEKVDHLMKSKIPIMLLGPTGTSKTKTILVWCDLKKQEFMENGQKSDDLPGEIIRFNPSAETTIDDLFGRLISDTDSFSGFKFEMGPYLTAFTKGYVFLLDECNLCPLFVLESIESSLDSGEYTPSQSTEDKTVYKMHKNFRLVITLNPNTDKFASKREELPERFKQRFNSMLFDSFKGNELKDIAKGIGKKEKYENEKIVENIAEFHYAWTQTEECQSSPQVFTIRDLSVTISSISNKKFTTLPEDAVFCFYGCRYEKKQRETMKNLLKEKFPLLYKSVGIPDLPSNFPECYHSESLKRAFYYSNIAINNGKHILFVSEEGSGLTQLAKWISDYFSKGEDKSKDFVFIFTKETTAADLLGRFIPLAGDDTNSLISWRDGPLTKIISTGNSGVFDNLNAAQAKVTERTNGLLDPKEKEDDYFFELPENPEIGKIPINKGFHFIATCNIRKIEELSPALLNRFFVLSVDDQLTDLSDENLEQIIEIIMAKDIRYLEKSKEKREEKEKNEREKEKKEKEKEKEEIEKKEKEEIDGKEKEGKDGKKIEEKDGKEESKDKKDSSNNSKKDEERHHHHHHHHHHHEKDDKKEKREKKEKEEKKHKEKEKNKYSHELIKPKEITRKEIPNLLIKEIAKKYKKNCYTISRLALLAKTAIRLYVCFPECEIPLLVNYCEELIGKETHLNIPINISNIIEKILLKNKQKSSDEKFYYKNSKNLLELMTNVTCCLIARIPVCLQGATGLGKTSLARALAEILRNDEFQPYIMYSFHLETQIDDLYGNFSFQDGQVVVVKGPVYQAVEYGKILIADEFNLSEEAILESLSIVLESSDEGTRILIPGISESVDYNKNFFFIACQNDLSTAARKRHPATIAKRIRLFEYPMPEAADIKASCEEIIINELNQDDDGSISSTFSKQISDFMYKINIENFPDIGIWSMRNIRKLFRRISNQQIRKEDYINIIPEIQILIYILGGVQPERRKGVFLQLYPIIVDCFNLDKEKQDILNFFNEGEIRVDEITGFLYKGNCGIKIPDRYKSISYELKSLWESIFYTLFCHFKEPILYCGESGNKTFLAQKTMPEANVLNINKDTTINTLLGSITLTNSLTARQYYLELILKICGKINEYNKLNQKLFEFFEFKKMKADKEEKEKQLRKEKEKKNVDDEEKSKLRLKKLEEKLKKKQKENKESKNKEDKKKEKKKKAEEEKKKKEKLEQDFSQKEETSKKFEKEINDIINVFLSRKSGGEYPDTLRNIIYHLKDKLLEDILEINNSMFGDFTTIFKAGVLIENVLLQKNIILKNLSNLSPSIFERLNDFYNYNPKITLNEDYCNTLTAENKELHDFSDGFRMIAVIPLDEIRNFSDAARSRLTVIYTKPYQKDERKTVIRNLYSQYPALFDDFLDKFEANFKGIKFSILIKIIKFAKEIDKSNEQISQVNSYEKSFLLSAYKCLLPLLKKDKRKLLIKIMDEVIPISEKNKYNFLTHNEFDLESNIENKNPFEFDKTESTLKCNETDYKIFAPKINNEVGAGTDIAFVNTLNYMLEYCHLSIYSHFPLIIKGSTGSGKNTAINYLAKYLGFELIEFSLSNSTTLEDLFCKEIPIQEGDKIKFLTIRSKLLDAIENKEQKNVIIYLKNIEQASANILEALIPVFDKSRKQILISTGTIDKGIYNLIVTFDPSSKGASFDMLPEAIKLNSILCNVPDYSKKEYEIIADVMFNGKSFVNEKKFYVNDFIKMLNFTNENQLKELFSLNDFRKFILFRQNDENNIIGYKNLVKLLLAHKFSSSLNIEKASKYLGYDKEEFWPIFNYDCEEPKNEEESDDDEDEIDFYFCVGGIKYKLRNIIREETRNEIEKKFLSFTLSQREAAIFLLLAVKANIICIINGPSGSGKGYLIRTFAEACGEKLVNIDLNNDSGVSVITGQITPKSELSQEEIDDLKKIFNKVIEIPELSDIILENLSLNSPNTWKPNNFRKILETIKSYPKEILEEHEILINELKNKILSELSFIKHLVNEDSPFIKAMIEGSWVNLDGIEKAQPELSERILSLCDPINPYLNLFEKGSNYYYSRTAEDPKFHIHENFRLFMTYNSLDVDPSKKLSEGFLNKNVVFSLFENDESNISSGLVLSGLFKQNKLFEKNATEMAARFANVHQYAKNLSKTQVDKFAGKKQFSGRTLNFVFNSVNNRDELKEQIISAIEDCYSISYENPEELKGNLLKKFCEQPSIELKNNINKNENEAEQKYSEINEVLENLAKTNTKLDFSLFVSLIGSCEYKYLKQLKIKISETQNKIINVKEDDYSLLQIIQNLIDQFLKRENITPKLKESFKIKQISKPSMSNENFLKYAQGKYLLLYALLKNDFNLGISYKNINDYLKEVNEEDYKKLIFYELTENNEKSNDLLSQALSIIYSYPELNEPISIKKDNEDIYLEKKELDKENSESSSNKSRNSSVSSKSSKSKNDSISSKSSSKSSKSNKSSKSSKSSESVKSSQSAKSKKSDLKKDKKSIHSKEDKEENEKKEFIKKTEEKLNTKQNIDKNDEEKKESEEMKLKKEDFKGDFKEVNIHDDKEEINIKIEEAKHIDINTLNIKGFQKDLLIIINKIISHIIITNKSDYKEEEKNKILEDPTLKIIISFFLNLEEVIKNKYFIRCINDDRVEDLLENIDLKDKNDSEELLERLDELKKLKFENHDKTDYSIIYKYINEWHKIYNEFYNKKLIQSYYMKQNQKEKAEIEAKLNNLKNELQKELREESQQYINKLNFIGLDKAKFEEAEKAMKKLIEAKKSEKKEEKNYISVFPPIKTKSFTNNTDFQKVLEILIYYSKIIELIDGLTDETKWYSVYLKLEKLKYKKDLDESFDLIINNLLNSIWKNLSQPDKKKEIIDDFKNQLRSCILLSLYNISPNYINMNSIRNELNRFIKGDYPTEQDKFWATGHIDYILPSFTLLIPEINIKDLIPLFALEKTVEVEKVGENIENLKEIKKGLFFSAGLSSTNAKTFFKEVIKLKEGEYKSYIELLDKIFELFNDLILKNMPIIKEEKEENEEKKEEKEKEGEKVIEKKENEINSKYSLIKKIMKENPEHTYSFFLVFLGNLYKYLPDNHESKIDISYKDIFFVNEPNWLKNFNKKYSQYPNIIYFLLDNRENYTEKKLIDYLSSLEKSNNKFPIFIHFLRIFGNNSYMEYNENKNKFICGEIIQSSLVRNILKRLESNLCSNLNWLMLLNDKIIIPKDLYNPRIEYFYNYLQFLSQISIISEEAKKIFLTVIDNLVDKILDIIFENKINEFFEGNIFNEKGEINENYKYFCKITSLVEEMALSKNKEDFKIFPKYFEERIQNLQKLFNKYYLSNKNNLYINIIDTLNQEIENNYKMEKEKDLTERINKKKEKLMKFNTNINNYNDEFKKLNTLLSEDKKNFEEVNKVVTNIKAIPFENDEKKKIFSDKKHEIEIYEYKIEKPNLVVKLELERKDIILHEYKQYFYAFSENHLYITFKNKDSQTKLTGEKNVIKDLDMEQVNKIKGLYQEEIGKLKIDETLEQPILELNDVNINQDLESDKLFINMKNFFTNFRKLINNLNEHIDNINLLQGYKEDTEKLLKDIKGINMLRPRLKDFALDEINRKCIEFGNFKDNVMKDLENLLNTYKSYENITNKTDDNKKIIPKEFNVMKLDNIKLTEKIIGFDSFDLNISTPYLSLSTDNKLQFCLKTYNQEINSIIPALYYGEKIKFNIISFVDKNVKSSFIFNEDNLITKQLSINQITKHNEPIVIKFEIPYEQVIEEEENDKITGQLNFEIAEESGTNLQIPFNFNFEFIPLNVIFESNYDFFFSNKKNLKYAFENSPLNLELFLSFRFEKSSLSFDKWKNNFSIEKLQGNEIEEEPKLIYQEDSQRFLVTFSKNEKLDGKKLNAKIKFYITKNLTVPIEISTTFHEKRFLFASLNEMKNNLDYDSCHIYLYEEVSEQLITFRVEYEDDSPHKIKVSHNNVFAQYGVLVNYLNGNTFEFKKGVTFKINFIFNKKYFDPNKFKDGKIYVQNEKNVTKYLTIELHIEEKIPIAKALLRGIKNFFFGEDVYERYWKIPHIGYNYRMKKYKFIEQNEKMSDYIKDEKELNVFYTPYKCVLVNKINILFYYYNSIIFSDDKENYKIVIPFKEDCPEIITIFSNTNNDRIWLPTIQYKEETEKAYFFNIEEEEEKIEELKTDYEVKNKDENPNKNKKKKKKNKKKKSEKEVEEKEKTILKNTKELPGEKIALKNLQKFKDSLLKYSNKLAIKYTNNNAKEKFKNFFYKSSLIYFIDYFSEESIDFKDKMEYLKTLHLIIFDEKNDSEESLSYFIKFDENRFKQVKNMFIYNLVYTILSILNKQYLKLKKQDFLFYDLSEHEKIRQNFFKDINEEVLIQKITKHKDIQPRKNKYEKEKRSTLWSFKENQQYPDIYKSEDSLSEKSTKTSESLKTVVEDLNIDKSMIETPNSSLLNNLESYEIFYKKLILICQAFPFFINKIESTEANKKFNFLYTHYLYSRYSNKCFINSNILSFNDAFEALCENLKNSNLNLNQFDKVNKGKKNLSFGNIIFPNPSIVSIPFKSKWYERKVDETKKINIEEKILNRQKEKTQIKLLDELKIPPKDITQDTKRPSTPTIRRSPSIMHFLPQKVEEVKLKKKIEDKEEEEKEELYSDEENEEKKDEKDDEISVVETGDSPKEISKKSLEKLKKEDVGKSLEKVFRVMEMEQKDDKLLLPSEDQFSKQLEDCYKMSFDEDKKDEEEKGLPVKNLIKLSRNLCLNFYRHIISLNLSTNRTCGIIAIDCFRAISIRDKIFNIILAAAMANCFDYLEMPYSVVVFADFKFQYIIKKYNEPHSDKIIQRILDAVLVKRFFTRIADVCWFIQCHPDLVHPDRNYRLVNIISSGLDPKLKIPEEWHGIFDHDEKTKFGFFFLPPYNPKYIDNLHTIWEKFKNELSVPLLSIDDNRKIVLGEYTDIVNNFAKIFSSIEYSSEEIKLDRIVKKRGKIESEIIESIDISLDNKFIEILEAVKNKEIIFDKIFIQNKPHELSKEKVLEDIKISSNHIIQKVNSYSNINEAIINQILSNDYKEGKRALVDLVFPPNKPSMYAPSRKGTRLYIMGLVNFVLTKGQDNKIWLDKIAGLVKDYRITVIIDNSTSCFNDLMNPHSFQSVISFLQIFSSISIPFFDIIIAKKEKPIILLSGQDSFNSLTSKSPVWPALVEILGKPDYNINIRDALTCLLKFRNLNAAKKHFAFIFTDGVFSNLGEKDHIKNYISQIEESGVSLFGVGLGFYPIGIKDIFGKCTWTLNPNLILNGICKLIDNEIKMDSKMTIFDFDMKNPEEVIENYEKNYRHNIVFRDLVFKLDEAELFPESMTEFINPEEIKSDTKVNPELNDKNGMASKGAFKGLKILCACFWSKNIAGEDEDERVDPKYLLERHPKSKFCLKDALDFYGIELTVKCNYKECIQLLQTGDYYACWVISGDGSKNIPDTSGNPNLVGQFVECLVRFWKIGGSLVFWSDSYPLFYETNLFLKIADFPEVGKLSIEFMGNDIGGDQMIPGNITEVKEKVFNEEKRFSDGKHYRPALSHNIVNIAIGTTISYINDEKKLYPLIPFGYAGKKDQDSKIADQNHCNILFYPSNREYPNGDIVFDGGFSKLFNELDSGENYSTFRYVQNIAAFTTQFAKRYAEYGDDWVETFKLPSFEFEMDETVIWTDFVPRVSNEFDIVYLIDATGSMGSTIQAAKDTVISIANDLKSKFPKINFQFGCVFYRDPVDSKSDKHTIYYLTNDINKLRNDISGEKPYGGNDGPEDFVGAYKNVFKMAWRSGTKLIIHIADAPAHCRKYCGYDNHEEESGKLEPYLQRCAKEKIKIICFDINNGCRKCFETMRGDYLPYGEDLLFNIENFDTSGSSEKIANNFKELVIASAACAVPKNKI